MIDHLNLIEKMKNFSNLGAGDFSEEQLEKFVQYVYLLHKWNKAYNLTAVRDPEEMLVKHILDSLAVGKFLEGDRFIDVGTGPGLPGIPLAIMFPEKHFVLLDSLGKRIQFLRTVLRELGLTNVTLVLGRVEDYYDEEGFDGVLSRAFASLKDMTTWCHHLPKARGKFYALKGQCLQEEIEALDEKFIVERREKLQIPSLIGDRHLILIKKC